MSLAAVTNASAASASLRVGLPTKRAGGDEERIAVGGLVLQDFLKQSGIGDVSVVSTTENFALAVKFVGQAL